MGVVQRTGAGSNPRISRVVSKPDSDHRTATMAHRTLGLTPAGPICLSLSYYPIHRGSYLPLPQLLSYTMSAGVE